MTHDIAAIIRTFSPAEAKRYVALGGSLRLPYRERTDAAEIRELKNEVAKVCPRWQPVGVN